MTRKGERHAAPRDANRAQEVWRFARDRVGGRMHAAPCGRAPLGHLMLRAMSLSHMRYSLARRLAFTGFLRMYRTQFMK